MLLCNTHGTSSETSVSVISLYFTEFVKLLEAKTCYHWLWSRERASTAMHLRLLSYNCLWWYSRLLSSDWSARFPTSINISTLMIWRPSVLFMVFFYILILVRSIYCFWNPMHTKFHDNRFIRRFWLYYTRIARLRTLDI